MKESPSLQIDQYKTTGLQTLSQFKLSWTAKTGNFWEQLCRFDPEEIANLGRHPHAKETALDYIHQVFENHWDNCWDTQRIPYIVGDMLNVKVEDIDQFTALSIYIKLLLLPFSQHKSCNNSNIIFKDLDNKHRNSLLDTFVRPTVWLTPEEILYAHNNGIKTVKEYQELKNKKELNLHKLVVDHFDEVKLIVKQVEKSKPKIKKLTSEKGELIKLAKTKDNELDDICIAYSNLITGSTPEQFKNETGFTIPPKPGSIDFKKIGEVNESFFFKKLEIEEIEEKISNITSQIKSIKEKAVA